MSKIDNSYLPDIIQIANKTFLQKINNLFSYKVFYLYPNKKNIKYIEGIIKFRLCPDYNHRLYYVNCFNSTNNYKVTMINVCHVCKQMFILTGRYSTKNKHINALKFFTELNKRRESNDIK